MKKILLIAIALVGTYTLSAQQTVEGVKVEGTLKVGEKTLQLNGAGLREKIFIDLYVGGLYTTTKSKDGSKIAAADEHMAITLDIVSSLVTQEKMIEAVQDGFESSATSKERKALKSKIDSFIAMFSSAIVQGNDFELAYIPGTGTVVSKNGKKIGTVEGLDFKKALFGIWLGPNSIDNDLKKGLLGKG